MMTKYDDESAELVRSMHPSSTSAMDDDEIALTYWLPQTRPRMLNPAIVAQLLSTAQEHEHIKDNEIHIEWLMKSNPVHKGGRRVMASVHEPKVQGRLNDLFGQMLSTWFGKMPDFLGIVDAEIWQSLTTTQQEALIWHELCHIKQLRNGLGELRFDQDGNPVFGLVEHDLTAFHSEVTRYGAWSEDISEFLAAHARHVPTGSQPV
jgi:hypothetical protein